MRGRSLVWSGSFYELPRVALLFSGGVCARACVCKRRLWDDEEKEEEKEEREEEGRALNGNDDDNQSQFAL